jgi:glutamate/tyrosine decarboxylase-like PLP-dependent enzyme
LAREFASWVQREPGFELSAPVPFSTVCFREVRGEGPEDQDARNQRILDLVNAEGPVFLSATQLRGRVVLRLAIGNVRTERRHVEEAWRLLREAAARA